MRRLVSNLKCAWPMALAVYLGAIHDGLAQERTPNIVLIMADDLGYRELGCYGQAKIQTPHLDRLAKEGMRFTQAYAGNAVCAPSRCVLMTGRHPGHASIRDNTEAKPEGQKPIGADDVTIAEVLSQAGYVTGAFGKWGLGPPRSEGDPLAQGFQRFFGYNCQRQAHSYYPSYLWADEERVPLDNSPAVPGHARFEHGEDPQDPRSYAQFEGNEYAPDRIHSAAMHFLQQVKEKPFFLYYPATLPHVALQIPTARIAAYRALGWGDPPYTNASGSGYTPQWTPRAAYAAMITQLDTYVGELLQELDRQGLTKNTIVMFTSDNGTTHLQEEVDFEFFHSVGELKGLKGSLYEGGIRVPFLVKWPGQIAPGTVSERVVGFEDLLPTLAKIAKAESYLPASLDGIDFTPTLRGDSQTPRDFLYREFPGYQGQQAVRFGPWKAVRQQLRSGTIKTELYHLARDPSESHDLAGSEPHVVAQAEKLMQSEHTKSSSFPLPAIDVPVAP